MINDYDDNGNNNIGVRGGWQGALCPPPPKKNFGSQKFGEECGQKWRKRKKK